MTWNPFTLLRTAARNAMLSGNNDALIEVQPEGAAPLTLAEMQQRLMALPAPAPAEEEADEAPLPVKRKR